MTSAVLEHRDTAMEALERGSRDCYDVLFPSAEQLESDILRGAREDIEDCISLDVAKRILLMKL